jgi:hypothetical protein
MSIIDLAFKIDILKMEQESHSSYRKGFHLSIRRGRRNSKNNTYLLGIGWRMKDLRLP